MIFKLEYKNKDLDVARLEITTPGLVEKTIDGTEDPFRLIYKLDKSDKSGHFLTSSAEINIYETEEFNIDALKTSNETEIKVDYYINNIKKWTGFVIPDFFSKEIGKRSVVSMVASDRIGTLKGVTLSDLNAFVSLRTLAEQCLLKTGLSLPLNTMVDLEADAINFFNIDALSQRLVDNKGRSISCYDILSSILVASNSIILQRNAEWYIVNKLQHELGQGRLYSNSTTFTNWQDIIHNFSDVTVGARRTIIPVAASTGVYHEHGGGMLHPDNYDFSKGLTGWTSVGGFVAAVDNKEIKGFTTTSSGAVYTPVYGNATEKSYLINENEYIRNVNPKYIESEEISIPYSGQGSIEVEVNVNALAAAVYATPVFILPVIRIAVVATNGSDVLTLDYSGKFVTMPSTNPPVHEQTFEKGEVKNVGDIIPFLTEGKRVKGTLEVSNLEQYKLKIRIYGTQRAVYFHSVDLLMRNTAEAPKGTIFKTEQGSNYTKEHEIDTSIWGDYMTGGLNGYFYKYPIDDTSSLYSNGVLTSKWTDITDPGVERSLLHHITTQQSRMFSQAHDLVSAEIDIRLFDPLSVYVACSKRYTLVSATVDFLRGRANLEIEEAVYQNLTKRDFIYSYFGDGETGIKSIGGISGGTGGGGGGGLTPEQIEILSFWKKDPVNPNTIFTEMNAYSKLELSAYGVGDGGGGGGDFNRLDVWADYDSSKAEWVLSALLGNDLNTRVTAIDGRVTDLENSAGSGSVTSVGISVPTGLSVSNSPITSSGVIAIGLQAGYSIPTTVKQGQWDAAFTNNHTHSNKTVLDGITSALISNWNTAFTNNHTHANKTVLDGITSALVNNWNTAYTNSHTHANKAQLDLITQANIDVLAKLSIVNGNLQINGNAYATGELSAYGAGDGGGGGGIIETVYGYGNLGQTFNNNVLTDTFNAYTINQINTRLASVESGSATTVNTTGTGNAITSISKSGSVITASKDIAFLETSIFNTHNTDNIRHITGAERTKWDGVVTDFEELVIGVRNLFILEDYNPVPSGGAYYHYINVEIGKQYTASTNIPKQDINTFDSWFDNEGVAVSSSVNGFARNNPRTITATANRIYIAVRDTTQINGIKNGTYLVKVEKGTKPTDWTPALEDQVPDWSTTDVNSFSFIKNKPTLLSQFTDNIGVATHIANTSNPHDVTKAQVGLGNVDNTADSAKNVLSATKLQTARTIAGVSFDGTANIAIPFDNLASKPTTLGGYGITDAVTLNTAQTITGTKTFRNWKIDSSEGALGIQSYRSGTGMLWPYGNALSAIRTGLGFGWYNTEWVIGNIRGGATDSYGFGIGYKNASGNLDGEFRIASGGAAYLNNVQIATISSNVASATKLQTPRTIWGQSFDGTGNVTGALSGATTIQATISVASPKVIFNAAGWSMEQVGSELQMKHNNVLKMRFTSTGSIVATEEITAFG
ncbi:hypothetical protein [Proteiniphilum sp. UBA5463]|jgi:hypothetical protein|uniref:hypothetical protein n=1 Tax=Proteiniphilum sp. UBA5463 TaxID=1947281 RepID=UPI00257D139E|nr:hypothetical protein [Proteiniphilum sp. UBA5463]